MDSTKDWFAVVRAIRQPSSAREQENNAPTALGAYSSAAEAVVGSRWRTPLTPFMQQATELNYGIRDMHTFLLEHFLDYVDVHHCLPSKRSLMTADEKDLIDLEVTSFMTACAAGVDALKALLQRERLRRMEQESAAARAAEEEDGQGLEGGGAGGGGGLRPGSRPAHEHAAVTFLFERLKTVTEVAETMQNERHRRAAARKARFYSGPAESRRDTTDDDADAAAARRARTGDIWKRTKEELEEERLLQASLPTAYGKLATLAGAAVGSRGAGANAHGATGTVASVAATAVSRTPLSARPSSSLEPLPPPPLLAGSSLQNNAASKTASKLASSFKTAASKTADSKTADSKTAVSKREGTFDDGVGRKHQSANEGRRRIGGQTTGVIAGGVSAVKRWTGGVMGGAAEGEGGAAGSVVPASVLEGENRELVARFKNELDDARLVETKMSEISGLMGLFASKVVEQQGGMEHVFDAAVSANDKLVRGGQHLEKAVQRGGAFRLFYAWFMMGASFCLLFLHFYNP